MSVKIYDKKQKKWIIFPGTIGAPGKDAYLIAQENGYTGTKEEYAKVLTDIPKVINSIEEEPTEGSKNLITSGGVWQAIDNVHTTINNQIKSSIVDNLESLAADKSLSANQGRILKEMIANLANLQIEVVDQLPSTGETNIIYLVKKSGSAPDIHDEYVFVDGKWEKIGNTEIDLSNYYTKSETYSQSEIDEKIGSAGGGDVMASGNLAVDYIIIGAGTKSIKNSSQTLSNLALKTDLNGYATQSWVNSQGFITEAGDNYYPTTFTWTNGTTAGPTGSLTGVGMSAVSFNAIPVASATQSGVVTTGDQSFAGEKTFMGGISAQDADISDLIIGSSLEFNAFGRFNYIATSTEAGGIKIGATASGVNLPLVLNSSNQAYIAVTKGAVTAALGFTPANVNDIPEIPIALPNPYALNVTAGGSTTSYTGSSASTINLDNIFSKQLPILTNADDAGKPGIYFTNSTTQVNVVARVTKEQPDAIVVVPSATPVVFDEPTVFLMDGIDSLSGGTYKCYCITWIAAAQSGLREDLILVNGAIYG